MKKAEFLTKEFNRVYANYVWVRRWGRKYILYGGAKGNIIDVFDNYTRAEERYLELQERQRELERQHYYYLNS